MEKTLKEIMEEVTGESEGVKIGVIETNAEGIGLEGIGALLGTLGSFAHNPERCAECLSYEECNNPIKEFAKLLPKKTFEKVADLTKADLADLEKLTKLAEQAKALTEVLEKLEKEIIGRSSKMWARIRKSNNLEQEGDYRINEELNIVEKIVRK